MLPGKKREWISLIIFFMIFLCNSCGERSKTDTADKAVKEEAVNEPIPDGKNDNRVIMYYFYGNGCVKCDEIKYDIEDLADKYKRTLKLEKHEVWYNDSNRNMLIKMAKERGKREGQLGTPAIIIGKEIYVGNKMDIIEKMVKRNVK